MNDAKANVSGTTMGCGYRKKNIYFSQAGYLYGVNAYLPYAAGCVAAYAWDNPLIREYYQLGRFAFLREPAAQVAASFDHPYMVAFSNYLLNFEYHKALAQAVKERWPDCLILFGGHHVYDHSSGQLEDCPFVDFLIHGAGEIPFELLLLALRNGTDLSAVPSLSYRGANGQLLRTKDWQSPPCKDTCCNYPSPYLSGIFEDLFEAYPSLLFSMTIETNRGCPYRCSYCDWSTIRHGLLQMPMERVQAEIDWAARHNIEFIYCADSNFGILERDSAIVDYLAKTKRCTGYPKKFNANFAKNSDESVFQLNQTLSAHGLNNGATLAFQSMSPTVLENIGRQNLDYERFRALVSLYNKAGVTAYTEMIVGLPGETLESYTQGIGSLLAAGLHGSFEVFFCELLPNAQLASPAQRAQHGIESVRVRQFLRHGAPESRDEYPEYTEIICQTNTMPIADWVTANMFSDVVQGLHSLNLLPCLAMLLHCEQLLPYERFYLDLMCYAYANPSTLLGELLQCVKQRYQAFSRGDGESFVYYHPRFGEVNWPLSEALFLCAAYESERLYDELPVFLRQYYALDEDILAQLIRYQRSIVQLPVPPPPEQDYDYDFPGYFAAVFAGQPQALQKRRCALSFPYPVQEESWADYARGCVWYGRRTGAMTRKGYEIHYDD